MNDEKNVKQLKRSLQNRKLCGVCGGIGEYLNLDPTVLRLIWIVLSIASFGTGLIAYIIAAIVMPESDEVY